MTQLVLVARLRDTSGALERLLGLLRRRSLPVESLSMYHAEAEVLEVAVRFGELDTPVTRVEAELNDLFDVLDVRRVDPTSSEGARELAIARTEGDPSPWPDELHPVVRHESATSVELAGTPEEIDHALEHLRARGVLAGAARSGEMYPPREDTTDSESP